MYWIVSKKLEKYKQSKERHTRINDRLEGDVQSVGLAAWAGGPSLVGLREDVGGEGGWVARQSQALDVGGDDGLVVETLGWAGDGGWGGWGGIGQRSGSV